MSRLVHGAVPLEDPVVSMVVALLAFVIASAMLVGTALGYCGMERRAGSLRLTRSTNQGRRFIGNQTGGRVIQL